MLLDQSTRPQETGNQQRLQDRTTLHLCVNICAEVSADMLYRQLMMGKWSGHYRKPVNKYLNRKKKKYFSISIEHTGTGAADSYATIQKFGVCTGFFLMK